MDKKEEIAAKKRATMARNGTSKRIFELVNSNPVKRMNAAFKTSTFRRAQTRKISLAPVKLPKETD